MAFTFEQAFSKIGTPGYTGIDGLTRLVSETSVIASNAAPDATTLLYSGDIGNAKAWQTANEASKGALDANGYKQLVRCAKCRMCRGTRRICRGNKFHANDALHSVQHILQACMLRYIHTAELAKYKS